MLQRIGLLTPQTKHDPFCNKVCFFARGAVLRYRLPVPGRSLERVQRKGLVHKPQALTKLFQSQPLYTKG